MCVYVCFLFPYTNLNYLSDWIKHRECWKMQEIPCVKIVRLFGWLYSLVCFTFASVNRWSSVLVNEAKVTSSDHDSISIGFMWEKRYREKDRVNVWRKREEDFGKASFEMFGLYSNHAITSWWIQSLDFCRKKTKMDRFSWRSIHSKPNLLDCC